VTRGRLPQRAGSPSLNGGGAAAAVYSPDVLCSWLTVTAAIFYCISCYFVWQIGPWYWRRTSVRVSKPHVRL